MKQYLRLFLLLVVVQSLSGCFLAPAIDSFKKLGVTAADREKLLAERIRAFNDALSAGGPGDAEQLLVPEKRTELAREIRKLRKSERVVDTKIEAVGFEDDSYKAKVEVTVRAYKVPFYIVNERIEEQEWQFVSVSSGWLLAGRTVIEEGANS